MGWNIFEHFEPLCTINLELLKNNKIGLFDILTRDNLIYRQVYVGIHIGIVGGLKA